MGDDYASNAPSKGGLTGWLGFGKTKSDRLKNEAAVGHVDGIGMGRRVLVTGGAGSLGASERFQRRSFADVGLTFQARTSFADYSLSATA